MKNEHLLKIDKVADFYDVSIHTIRRWMAESNPTLPEPVRLSKRSLRWSLEELKRSIEGRAV